MSPRLRELATTRMLDRARVLGAAMRVAYILTAGQSGVLPKTPMQVKRGRLILRLPGNYGGLASDRLAGRLRQLARLWSAANPQSRHDYANGSSFSRLL